MLEETLEQHIVFWLIFNNKTDISYASSCRRTGDTLYRQKDSYRPKFHVFFFQKSGAWRKRSDLFYREMKQQPTAALFDFITKLTLVRINLYSYFTKSEEMDFLAFSMLSSKFSLVRVIPLIRFFINAHTFSIMFRSGLHGGHSIVWIWILAKTSLMISTLWTEQLSSMSFKPNFA